MPYLRSFGLLSALIAVLIVSGCAPSVVCVVETEVYPDYSVARVTRLEAYPNPRFQQQRPRLSDYFQFPPAELYDSYVVQQDKVLFAGVFNSFDQIPSDLVRGTSGTTALAGNLFSFRIRDLVLFVLADFDETVTDIVVSQEDGEAALLELLRLAVPEVMSVLKAKYGTKYDLSRLESWLYNDLPAKLRRLYAGAWAIHSAKRSGVTSPGEDYEFYMFLKAEAKREGLELVDPGTPNQQQENVRRLKEYGMRLAQNLLIPLQGGAISSQELSGIAMDELVASIQKAITARHGSVNNFVGKIAALVPRAFGAYLTGMVMPIYMLPETTYQYRLRVPGQVLQTNGVRELNGDLIWNLTDRDLAFTGQSLWVRSIFTREPAVNALGLRGFPADLGDVDALLGMCLGTGGAPREEILKALAQSIAARGFGPLEAIAANSQSPDAQAARSILDLFNRHKAAQASRGRGGAASAAPEPAPVQLPSSQSPEPSTAVVPVMEAGSPPLPEPDPSAYGGGTAAGRRIQQTPLPNGERVTVPTLEPSVPPPTAQPGAIVQQVQQPPPLPEPSPVPEARAVNSTANGGPFSSIEPPSLPPPVQP